MARGNGKRGLSKKEASEVRKMIKSTTKNMAEPKQHVITHSVYQIPDYSSGGVIFCLTNVPRIDGTQHLVSDNTRGRFGNEIQPTSLTCNMLLHGATEGPVSNGKPIDYVRVVLFRWKGSSTSSFPDIQGLFGGNYGHLNANNVLTTPLGTFDSPDLVVLEDRKVMLTGDMDDYISAGGSRVRRNNAFQEKNKLLTLRVPFKKMLKKYTYDPQAGLSNEHNDGIYLALIQDGLNYGLTGITSDPTVTFDSTLRFRDIGA